MMSLFGFFMRSNKKSSKETAETSEKNARGDDQKVSEDLTLPCVFPYYFPKEAFDKICYKVAKTFPPIINVKIYDACVICTVRSRSGITDWEFEYDFNDFGKFSKSYNHFSENKDSIIPNEFFKRLTSEIDTYIEQETKEWYETDCPNCKGKMVLKDTSDVYVCPECLYTLPKNVFEEGSGFVFYFCDHCNSYLNTQKGFTLETGKWKCTKCGRITGLEIVE